MEKVDRKICLDSDIIIEILKDNKEVIEKISALEAVFHTTSVNIFEIWSGRLKKEENQISGILEGFKKDNFEEKHAFLAGDIHIKLKETGSLVDFRDLFIGAICIENKLELLTNNKKHFERIKQFGLKLI